MRDERDSDPSPRDVLDAVQRQPSEALLAFDFDGTLASIHPDPEAVQALPGVVESLTALAGLGVQVAIISGRPASFPAGPGGMSAVPNVVVVGRHGVETWEAGVLHSPDPPVEVDEARQVLRDLVARAPAGTHLEDKGYSVAVHTRRCAHPDAALAEVEPEVAALAERLGLEVIPGRYVREIRPAGDDKGDALAKLVERFAPRTVVFCGDDLGDVPAFMMVRALRDGIRPSGVRHGLAIAVAAPELPEVGERADLVLGEPAALRDLLHDLAQRAVG